jgi:hypothetical protein
MQLPPATVEGVCLRLRLERWRCRGEASWDGCLYFTGHGVDWDGIG